MANKAVAYVAAAFAATVTYVGGWSGHIWTLVLLMSIDFAVGVSVPVFMGKSKKSADGKIESHLCRRGIIKKCVMFLMVYVSYLLGTAAEVSFVADAVCIAFIVSEVISIIEHAAVIGVPIPAALRKVLKVLSDKADAGVDMLAGKPEEKAEDGKVQN